MGVQIQPQVIHNKTDLVDLKHPLFSFLLPRIRRIGCPAAAPGSSAVVRRKKGHIQILEDRTFFEGRRGVIELPPGLHGYRSDR